MLKLHLTQPWTIEKDGNPLTLTGSVYNISDEKLVKANGFFKCCVCKDYFDKICEKGYGSNGDDRQWCEEHFPR